jgi:hypothetical protein
MVIVGEVISATAFLSNDRTGVYTEFRIKVKEVLKGEGVPKRLVADREGGVVIYPNGQRVFYRNSQRALPMIGSQYLFFLVKRGSDPNYEIGTSYSLEDSKIYQLENGQSFDQLKGQSKARFLDGIRGKVAEPHNQ